MSDVPIGTRIVRTRVIEGAVLPAIIHNSNYFFINLPVYEDGLMDCWEMVDLPLFQGKLRSGWVVTSIPDGEAISIHGLGSWTVHNGQWNHTADDYFKLVEATVKMLNPQLRNLHNCHGETSHAVGNMKVSTLSSGDSHPARQDKPGVFSKRLRGDSLSVFVSNPAGGVTLATLRVFRDGIVELGRLPTPMEMTVDALADAIESGRILRAIPEGTAVVIHGLGSFVAGEEQYASEVDELLLEVRDILGKLNGEKTAVQRCRDTFEAYLEDPTEEMRAALKEHYEAVPTQQRPYVGDMDTKDVPIRMVIYGEEEIESWSHRLVAREQGMEPLPTIEVPKPK